MKQAISAVLSLILGFIIGFLCHFNKLPLIINGEELGSVADWLGAIGTIGAVIIALCARYDPERRELAKIIYNIEEENQKYLEELRTLVNHWKGFTDKTIELAKYCYPDKVTANQKELTSQLMVIKDNIQEFLNQEWLSNNCSSQAKKLKTEISAIVGKKRFNKKEIMNIYHVGCNFSDRLIKEIWNQQEIVEESNKKIQKTIKKHHIKPIYFLSQK